MLNANGVLNLILARFELIELVRRYAVILAKLRRECRILNGCFIKSLRQMVKAIFNSVHWDAFTVGKMKINKDFQIGTHGNNVLVAASASDLPTAHLIAITFYDLVNGYAVIFAVIAANFSSN